MKNILLPGESITKRQASNAHYRLYAAGKGSHCFLNTSVTGYYPQYPFISVLILNT